MRKMNLNYTIKNTFSNIYIPTISSFYIIDVLICTEEKRYFTCANVMARK